MQETSSVTIRPALIDKDLLAIIAIHQQSFPNFFMTQMGFAFLQDYYQQVLNFPKTIALVAVKDTCIIGFIVGFGHPYQFYQNYSKHKQRLFLIILMAILRRPFLLKRILYNRQRITQMSVNLSEVELSSLGVLPKFTRQGIGSLLIQSFLEIARYQSYHKVYLTTDKDNNQTVNQFYLKHHFQREKTLLSGDRFMNYYTFNL